MKVISIQFILLLLCLVFGLVLKHDAVYPSELTGLEVMEKQEEATKSKDETVTINMELHSSGKTRKRSLICYFKNAGTRDKYLIKFLHPQDIRNTGLLTIEHEPFETEDDQWLYLPELRKSKRISGRDKRDSFVGSDLTYEDMRPENLDTHSYELVGIEMMDGVKCFHIEAFPATSRETEESAYSKRELWIRTDNYVTVQIKYYNHQGKFYKLASFTGISTVKGYWRANRVEVEDFAREHKTILTFADRKIDEGLENRIFTLRELEQQI